MNIKESLKKVSITLLMILSVSIGFSQDSKERDEIEKMTLKMFNDMNQKNFDSIVNMTYPKVFEIASKEMLKDFFKSMFEGNEEFSISIDKEIPKYKVSEIFKDEKSNLDFAFVSYSMKMNMTFLSQEFDEETKEIMIKMMAAQGMEVNFVSNNSMRVIQNNSLVLFLKDDITNQKWKMLNYNPDSPIFFKMLPIEVIEKSKDYYQGLLLENAKTDTKN